MGWEFRDERHKAQTPGPSPADVRIGGISSFTLKMVAIAAMTCNHAAYIFAGHLPFLAYTLLIAIGGVTFPIMGFLIAEGYHYTSNVRRYALRLLLFALIAQIPFSLFLGNSEGVIFNTQGNVLFTLLAGLAMLYLDDHVQSQLAFAVCFLAILLLSAPCDWGVLGPVMIYLYKRLRPSRLRALVPSVIMLTEGFPNLVIGIAEHTSFCLGNTLYAFAGGGAAMFLINQYNGRRGRPLKYFFYLYYPLHIAALGILALAIG